MKKFLFIISLVFLPATAFAATKLSTSFVPYGSSLGSGLVGYWTFDGGNTAWSSATAGTTNDISGQGDTGTLTSMTQAGTPAQGKIGQSLTFNGSSAYVTMGDPASGALDFGTNSFSFGCWARSSSATGSFPINKSSAFNAAGYDISWAGTAVARIFDGSNNAQTAIGARLDGSGWHHLFAVIDRTNQLIMFYVDGVQQGASVSTASVGSVSNTTQFSVGSRNAANGFFNGQIDDVRVYNRALTAAEVKQLFLQSRFVYSSSYGTTIYKSGI